MKCYKSSKRFMRQKQPFPSLGNLGSTRGCCLKHDFQRTPLTVIVCNFFLCSVPDFVIIMCVSEMDLPGFSLCNKT